MKRKYRVWSLLERRAAVDRMASVKHGELAAELGISTRQLYAWRDLFRRLKEMPQRESILQRENRKLKVALAARALEADFLKGVLRAGKTDMPPPSPIYAALPTRCSLVLIACH